METTKQRIVVHIDNERSFSLEVKQTLCQLEDDFYEFVKSILASDTQLNLRIVGKTIDQGEWSYGISNGFAKLDGTLASFEKKVIFELSSIFAPEEAFRIAANFVRNKLLQIFSVNEEHVEVLEPEKFPL